MTVSLFLHVLSVVVWVGGMVFAYMALGQVSKLIGINLSIGLLTITVAILGSALR
jgi:uncharacterized membrane protein